MSTLAHAGRRWRIAAPLLLVAGIAQAASAAPVAGTVQAPAASAAPVADAASRQDDEAAIRLVIATMQDAWNRGDFRGYMQGFLDPGVVFVSRGRFQRDWQGTLDHYVRDYGGAPERRGVLCFHDIRIELLADDAAQLISRYRLDRVVEPQYGINTRLMRKVDGRWVIALNHVSSVEAPDPQAPVPAACPRAR